MKNLMFPLTMLVFGMPFNAQKREFALEFGFGGRTFGESVVLINSIKSIRVLKVADTSFYGSRGGHGIIEIITF